MNVERLKIVAEVLEDVIKTEKSFDLTLYVNDCGTAACAIGWTVLSGKIPELSLDSKRTVLENNGQFNATEFFDLEYKHLRYLFFHWDAKDWNWIRDHKVPASLVLERVNKILEVGKETFYKIMTEGQQLSD